LHLHAALLSFHRYLDTRYAAWNTAAASIPFTVDESAEAQVDPSCTAVEASARSLDVADSTADRVLVGGSFTQIYRHDAALSAQPTNFRTTDHVNAKQPSAVSCFSKPGGGFHMSRLCA